MMRVSIWNQFSSNHSGSMTIVGNFETIEKAMEAEGTLRQIIEEVNDWFDRPENDRYRNAWMGDPPAPGLWLKWQKRRVSVKLKFPHPSRLELIS
jgi:hypothetical protein